MGIADLKFDVHPYKSVIVLNGSCNVFDYF